VDTRGLRAGSAAQPENWAERWEGETDGWGIVWAKAPFGHPYEAGSPLHRTDLTVADVARYPWPQPPSASTVAELRERALRVRDETDFALVLSLPYYPFTQTQLLRGHANWLMDLAADRPLTEALLDGMTETLIGMAQPILSALGEIVDVVCWGDDVSIQTGPMLHPEAFRSLVKPRYRRMMDALRGGTQAKIYFHSCGSVHWLVPDLVDLGIDILNPVQVSAADMDTAVLKREFGKDIVFWGGGCDSQSVLPFATPQQVREEVRRRIGDLAPGGGFVFAPVHTINADVPPENVVAMYDAAAEFGRY
jgi:uroporphyrinogen decarboxylase